ncbi:MAG: RdgB/HAM1 family non-canonical purine NTP pyrophosphatase [Balneolia bacterium]|nr:RdgB/HAM1 family non-canonical purine NTP pyrophosphatase [Balneolia bacterium]
MSEKVKDPDTPDFEMPELIVLASSNPHKVEELRATLAPLNIGLKSSADFPGLDEVVEDAPTLQGNALKKAEYLYKMTGLPSLADDTGLEVDALDGRPGVYSARYAGEKASYEDNVQKLLREMKGQKDRKARFRTALVFMNPSGTFIFNGVCDGAIRSEKSGSGGFGYDPVFEPAGYSVTFAELDQDEKNAISHRGRAVQKFVDFLQSIPNAVK